MARLPRASLKRGSIYLLVAWLFGTSMAILAKEVEPLAGVWMILFFQGWVSLTLNIPSALKAKKALASFHSWKLLTFRTVSGFISFLCIFLAVSKTALINVLLLDNTAPIFIPIAAFFWLKAKIPKAMWLGILTGFAGILCILQPSADILKQHGVLLALIAGVFMALIQISIRLMASKEHPFAILFYYFMLYTLIATPFAIFFWKLPSLHVFWLLMGSSVCSFGMQVCFIKAFSYARPVEIGPLNYSAVVYSYLAGWILWEQNVSFIGFVGVALVVIGGILTIYIDKKTQFKSKL